MSINHLQQAWHRGGKPVCRWAKTEKRKLLNIIELLRLTNKMSQSTWHLEPNQAGGWLYTCIVCLFYILFIEEDRGAILLAIFGCRGTILLGNCRRWVIGSLSFLDQNCAGCWLVLHIIVDWFATWRAGCLDLDISLKYHYLESSKYISGSTINHQQRFY